METAKLFNQGNSQAVRLPKEFQLQGDEVFIKRDGDHVGADPSQNDRTVDQTLKAFTDDLNCPKVSLVASVP